MKRHLVCAVTVLALAACAPKEDAAAVDAAPATQAAPETASSRLETVLAALPEAEKARYAARHPKEMIEFFGLQPGMTVVEVLPGEGWWTKVLMPYLGSEGKVIGADYALPMWAKFGAYAPDPVKQATWAADWPGKRRLSTGRFRRR
jgi:predicted methyltransferase